MTTPDSLSPEPSPEMLTRKSGVRRVNNIPLLLVIGIFTIFVVIVALVAVKRADAQHEKTLPMPVSSGNTDSSAMAAQVIGDRKGGGILPTQKPVTGMPIDALPIVKVNGDVPPPLPPRLTQADSSPNPDFKQHKSDEWQAFEKAVNSKTTVAFGAPEVFSGALTNRTQLLNKLNALQQSQGAFADAGNTSYQAQLAQLEANLHGQGSGINNSDQNNAIAKFAGNETPDRWTLGHPVPSLATPYELRAGAVIPGVMISGVNSDLPGQIEGQVSENVYDTATGKYLLIPQGTRLIGTYSSNIIYGQSAVLIAWQRLVFPDGKAMDIGAMSGADSAGYTGFRDQVNNHYMRIFSSAILMSAIVASIAYSQEKNQQSLFMQPTMNSEMSQALGQQLGQVTAQLIQKNLNIAPTLQIRPGYRFNIMVSKDMVFPGVYASAANSTGGLS